jgi:hypothetical protein
MIRLIAYAAGTDTAGIARYGAQATVAVDGYIDTPNKQAPRLGEWASRVRSTPIAPANLNRGVLPMKRLIYSISTAACWQLSRQSVSCPLRRRSARLIENSMRGRL